MDVKRSPAVIRLWLKRIRDKRGRVCRDAGIHVVAIHRALSKMYTRRGTADHDRSGD